MKRLTEALTALGDRYDIIVVTEVMYSDAFESLRQQLKQLGFWYYNQGGLSTQLAPPTQMWGGVWVFSRLPITQHNYVIYPDGAASDWFANKGVVYTRIALRVDAQQRWHHLHLLATHLQAWDGAVFQDIRQKQLDFLNSFSCRLGLPLDEPLILVGDFNMSLDRTLQCLNNRPQGCYYSDIVRFWGDAHLAQDGDVAHRWVPLRLAPDTPYPYTWDPMLNKLVGLDNIQAYDPHAGACTDEYYRTQRCVCCKPELLDHIFISDRHLQPDYAYSTVEVRPVVVKPFSMRYAWNHTAEFDVISDHFPLSIRLCFPASDSRKKATTA
jgi:endonuclease/exonuclease/phosphatase family metal-dependent hydrolase